MINPAFIGVSTKDRKNHGNIVHAVAARRLLVEGAEFPYAQPWSEEDIEKIRQHSHIVVVMANAVCLGVAESPFSGVHTIIADNLRRAKMPTVVLGLGSQGQEGSRTDGMIPPGTQRLIDVLGDQSVSIACRGPFTVDVLAKHGVKNGEPIGCQSAFWHGKTNAYGYAPRSSKTDVAFNYSVINQETDIIEWGVANRYWLVGQTEFWEEAVSLGENPPMTFRQEHLIKQTGLSEADYRTFCQERFKYFHRLEEWLAFMAQLRLSIGTRFHGNMAALIAGVPALWFVHDARTRELCELLGLPSISLKQAKNMKNIDDFAELADFSNYKSKYGENYNRFHDYIRRNGLALKETPHFTS